MKNLSRIVLAITLVASASMQAGFSDLKKSVTETIGNFSTSVRTQADAFKGEAGRGFEATKAFAKDHYVYASALVVLGVLGWEGIKAAYAKLIKPTVAKKMAAFKAAKEAKAAKAAKESKKN